MDDDAKPTLLVRRYSASAAGLRVAVGKTPLERMNEVTRLSRQLRAFQKQVAGGRAAVAGSTR